MTGHQSSTLDLFPYEDRCLPQTVGTFTSGSGPDENDKTHANHPLNLLAAYDAAAASDAASVSASASSLVAVVTGESGSQLITTNEDYSKKRKVV